MTTTTGTSALQSYLPAVPSNALLYQKAALNPIAPTQAQATSLGYLSTNKTQLEVVGELTSQDPTDLYTFTYQNAGQVNLKLTNITGSTAAHVQILDGSGSRVLADNQGNATTLAAWNSITSTDGLKLSAGSYTVKVTYATGASKSTKQDYAIQIGSGTTFSADYRTLASPTTIAQTTLAGGTLNYSPATTTASLLANEQGGNSIDIFSDGIL